MNAVISTINDFLCLSENHFATEKNKMIHFYTADLYAFRKAGMAGRDYFFIHDTGLNIQGTDYMQAQHEDARSYVNSLYKLPKILRFKVPNIISVFVSGSAFPEDTIHWAAARTRSILGGEFHAVYLIDLSNKAVHGQGTNQVYVKGGRYEFSNIDPQNRAYHLILAMGNYVFERF